MRTRTFALRFRPFDLTRLRGRLVAALRGFLAARAHNRLNAAALRDLGLDPSEWDSLRAEIAGRATPTRRRVAR